MTGQYEITTSTSRPRTRPIGAGTLTSVRTAGVLCGIGGAMAVVGAIWEATYSPVVTSDQMSYPLSPDTFRVTEVIVTITHLLTLFGAIGLARSGLAGHSRTSRIGNWIAITGMALLVPAELSLEFVAHSRTDSGVAVALASAIGVAAVIAGIGFTWAGVTTLRAGVWRGWGRWIPLLSGLFVLLVLLPMQGIWPSLFLWPIAAWNVLLLVLGLALIGAGPATPTRD